MPDEDATSADASMTWRSPWELLRRSDFDGGLQILCEQYELRPTAAGERKRLGIGYLWAEKYDAALAHFTIGTKLQRNCEIDFAYAGAAEWHLGNPASAIRFWRSGLKAQYAVGCRVCSMTARLLVVASAFEPYLVSKNEAERLLLEATERIEPSRWSGLLGRFILGQIDVSEVKQWTENRDREVKEALNWVVDFYSIARNLNHSEIDVEGFRRYILSMVERACSESTDIKTLIHILSRPEFFLARTEAAKIG